VVAVTLQIGGYAIILDEQDAPLVTESRYRWAVRDQGEPRGLSVVRRYREGGRSGPQRYDVLSRLIARPEAKERVYFKNNNPLDLRRANLEVGKGRARLIPCPFSDARLDELYWTHGLSSHKIGAYASQVLGRDKPVPAHRVLAWLRAANVRLRDRRESTRLRVRKHPDTYRRALAKARRVRSGMVRRGEIVVDAAHLHAPRVRRKIRVTKRRQFEAALLRQRCARVGCSNVIVRSPAQVAASERRGQRNLFCSHRCAAIHTNRHKQISRRGEGPPLPDWLTEAVAAAKGVRSFGEG
jgi:hypothetical protein